MSKSDYAGKIKNSGVQRVEAPVKKPAPKPGVVKTGSDLRTGKK